MNINKIKNKAFIPLSLRGSEAAVAIARSKNKAFTLAEVLITLAVIGVVAAIVVPALLGSTNDAELKTMYKKIHSDLNQATKLLMNDNGGTTQGLCKPPFGSCGSANGDGVAFANTFVKYLNYTTFCPRSSTAYLGNCWSNQVKYLNGDLVTPDPAAGAVLSSGAFILFGDYDYDGPFGDIYIDVNGFKGPNQYGKDVFWDRMFYDHLAPVGYPGSGVGCDKSSGNASFKHGEGCAAKVLLNQDY